MSRITTVSRKTKETEIFVRIDLDHPGTSSIGTGIGFLDHMLVTLARHSGIDFTLWCKGDLHIDDHHTAEDCALAVGQAIDQALGDRRGIARYGFAYAPLDESLARVVVDFSGRPCAVVSLMLTREKVGELATENVPHFFRSLATAARMTLHVDVIRGENDHHKCEAAFKALALALKQAVALTTSVEIPSTKGTL